MEIRKAELKRVLSHLDTLYELGEDCVHPDTQILVSDTEYDDLLAEFKVLAPDDDRFKRPTDSNVNSGVKKIKHNPPLTSISKASHEDLAKQTEMLEKWVEDCGDVELYQTYKLDGVALALYYEDGKLVGAGLRPRNGIDGEDVTEQVKYVAGIPQKLKLPVTCSIRGELICKLSDFEEVQKELARAGEKLRANPRNHAAGSIRNFKDPPKVADMRLSFIAYTIEGLAKLPYKTEIERAKWANTKLGITYVQARPFEMTDLQKMEDNVPNLDYEVDGVVIGVNNLEEQEQLGRHGDTKTGNPKGKIAWKFREESACPPNKFVTWKTNRTGAIKPVANFDPVSLAGTQVARATLHNAGFMMRNKITVGTVLRVLKAGKIIPKVVGVVSGQGDPEFPKECPSCRCKTELVQGGSDNMWELMCNNDDCPSRNISALCHYLSTLGVLGVGESSVAALVEGGEVRCPADFYKLTELEFRACDFSEREGLLAEAAIWMIPAPEKLDNAKMRNAIKKARKTGLVLPAAKIFASFGMSGAGKSAGKVLVETFGDFDKIRKAVFQDLESIDGVGAKTADVIIDYFKKNEKDIDDLLKFITPELPKTGKLTGKTFCLSGGFAEGKAHWEKAIEDLGGKCSGSVGKKTDYLVAGDGSGSKSDKAKELGVPIIDVDALKKLL